MAEPGADVPDVAVVCWLWSDASAARQYEPRHVNVLASMVRRHLPVPHRLVCITDEPAERFGAGVTVLPVPAAARAIATLRTPEGRGFPSSYRRLWAFSAEARVLGATILQLDIDVVITGDLAPLLARLAGHSFVGWRPAARWGARRRFGGGIWLLRAGAHATVWTQFAANPAKAIALARRAGQRGSDQAWISHCLADTQASWPDASGICSVRDWNFRKAAPPGSSRVVQFNGRVKPWQLVGTGHWVDQHWH